MLFEAPIQTEPSVVRFQEARRAVRGIFSFPGLLATLLVVVTIFTVRERFSDPDMWWHLKAGEIIWNSHSIPRADVFSFTAAGKPWTAQEWLSQAIIYAVYHFGGYSGLMLLLCLMSSALVLAGYAVSALYSGDVKIAFLGGLTTWLFATIGLAVRPHMFGYFLLISELAILHLGRTRDLRWFYALPPLFALWINLHSSFVFGLVVLAVILSCSFLEFEWGLLVTERWSSQARKTLAIASGLSSVALLLDPVGPKLIWYPFEVMFNQPINLGFVAEWQQPDFVSLRGMGLLIAAGLIIAAILVRKAKLHVYEAILLALLFYLGVRHERMVLLFGIVAGPILSRLLAGTWAPSEPDRDRIIPNAILMAISALAVVLAFPNRQDLKEQVDRANPVKALEFIQHSGLSGRMLNNYGYGGYLIWAAPERKVFVDGRADVYEPAGVLADYVRFMNLAIDPRSVLEKYRIDFCFFAQDDEIAHVLPLLTGWKKIYSDKQSVIYARQS